MQLDTHDHPKPVSSIHEPGPAENAAKTEDKRRRMTLSTEEADRLADLVERMRERH